MLVYLDANIVQYCADYSDFLFGEQAEYPIQEPHLLRELLALRQLIALEQLGDWSFAAPPHLLAELRRGSPTPNQLAVYSLLEDSFGPEWAINEGIFREVVEQLAPLQLRDEADQAHLAYAVALGASWFLTLDRDILRKTRGQVRTTRVVRPSACVPEISVGLLMRTA
jgi:hypothetical protein